MGGIIKYDSNENQSFFGGVKPKYGCTASASCTDKRGGKTKGAVALSWRFWG